MNTTPYPERNPIDGVNIVYTVLNYLNIVAVHIERCTNFYEYILSRIFKIDVAYEQTL